MDTITTRDDLVQALKMLGCIPPIQLNLVSNIITEFAVGDPEENVEDSCAFNLLQFLQTQSDQDNLTLWLNVQGMLLNSVIDRLSNYGVFIYEEDTTIEDLSHLYQILVGINRLEHYEDKPRLLNTLNVVNNVRDGFIEALHIVNDELNLDRTYELISKINENLIYILADILESQLEEEDVPAQPEYAESQLAKRRIQVLRLPEFSQYVDPSLQALLGSKPFILSIRSILALMGNAIADMPNSEYNWLTVVWLSKEGDIDILYDSWDKHFLEESKRIETVAKLGNVCSKFKEYLDD